MLKHTFAGSREQPLTIAFRFLKLKGLGIETSGQEPIL